jgi:hypothetical protein
MKYQESVYNDFSSFLAKATEIAKDKIGLYNSLLDPPSRIILSGNSFKKFLEFIILVLSKFGWFIYVAIAGLLGFGVVSFYAGMGTLIATNPLLAVGVGILGGSVYLAWKNKDVYIAHNIIGKRYKVEFENINKNYSESDKRYFQIEKLLKNCVKSLCIEVFNITSDEFINEAAEDV